jgi:hypothetical protein
VKPGTGHRRVQREEGSGKGTTPHPSRDASGQTERGSVVPFPETGSLQLLGAQKRGTKFVELPPKSVINSPESTRMGFWSLNPYVGCEFGCTYCYARYAHRYVVERAHDAGRLTEVEFADLQHPRGLEPFEHRIFVKSPRSTATSTASGVAPLSMAPRASSSAAAPTPTSRRSASTR